MSARYFVLSLPPVLALPWSAEAITFVQFLNLFNIFVGVYLAVTLLVFFGGLAAYFLRYGTWPSHRDSAIKIMEWGVAMLFVLVVLVALVQAFERHTAIAMAILAGIVVIAVAVFALRSFMAQPAEKPAGNRQRG